MLAISTKFVSFNQQICKILSPNFKTFDKKWIHSKDFSHFAEGVYDQQQFPVY